MMRVNKILPIYYLAVFLLSITCFLYGYTLYDFAQFILGYTSFYKSIILISIFFGIFIGSQVTTRFLSKYQYPLKFFVYTQISLLIFVTLSKVIFQYIVENNSIGYVYQASISIIILFLFGVLFGILFPLAINSVIKKNITNYEHLLYGSYFIHYLGIATSVLIIFFYLVANYELSFILIIANVLTVISLVLMISFFQLCYKFQVDLKFKNNNIDLKVDIKNSKLKINILLLSVFLTGLFLSIYFISWFRFFEIVLGSTVQIKAIIISCFFLSFAMGSLFFRYNSCFINKSIKNIARLYLIISALSLVGFIFHNYNFILIEFLKSAVDSTDSGYKLYIFSSYFIILINILPACFFAGVILPGITIITLKDKAIESAVGNVYSFVILGVIFGVIFSYSVGLVYLGLKFLLCLSIFINLTAGFILFLCLKSFFDKKNLVLFLFIVVLFFYALTWVRFNPNLMMSGFASSQEQGFYNYFNYDGRDSTVQIQSKKMLSRKYDPQKGPVSTIIESVSFLKNGMPFSAGEVIENENKLNKDEVESILFSAIILGINSNISNIMNIGFGSGFTSSLFLLDKELKNLDIIEIEPGVVKGALLFGDKVKNTYQDKRSNIIISDIINYLRVIDKKYNVIATEYSHSYFQENSFIFTTEFYKLANNHLAANGILAQKINIADNNYELLSQIFNAISENFKNYNIYFINENNLIVIASNSKIPDINNKIFTNEKLRNFLDKADIKNIEDIKIRYSGNKNSLNNFFLSKSKGINSYFKPVVMINSGKAIFNKDIAREMKDVNLNNLLFQLEGVDILDQDITSSIYFTKSKLYSDAKNLYNGIMLYPSLLNKSEFFLLLPQNNIYIISEEKWFNGFIDASKLILNYLSEAQGKNIIPKIVTRSCYNRLSKDKKDYIDFVNNFINKNYYGAIASAEQVLKFSNNNSLTSLQKASVFKYLLLSLIKIDKKNLVRVAFENNYRQFNLDPKSIINTELLFLYFYSIK